jgi:dihydrofolate reductase
LVRRIRYAVAASLDGYIAGPDGEAEWIILDPKIDFGATFKEFDTVLLGRRTFQAMTQGGRRSIPGMQTFVFSRTLQQQAYPEVTVISEREVESITALRDQPGKDIWLMGGGTLFRGLLAAGLVDTVEVSIVPVLLGAGVPLLPTPATQAKLKLTGHTVYDSGIVSLRYVTVPQSENNSGQSEHRPRS